MLKFDYDLFRLLEISDKFETESTYLITLPIYNIDETLGIDKKEHSNCNFNNKFNEATSSTFVDSTLLPAIYKYLNYYYNLTAHDFRLCINAIRPETFAGGKYLKVDITIKKTELVKNRHKEKI